MKKKKRILFLFLTSIILLTGCGTKVEPLKPSDELLKITGHMKNVKTFTVTVDGKFKNNNFKINGRIDQSNNLSKLVVVNSKEAEKNMTIYKHVEENDWTFYSKYLEEKDWEIYKTTGPKDFFEILSGVSYGEKCVLDKSDKTKKNPATKCMQYTMYSDLTAMLLDLFPLEEFQNISYTEKSQIRFEYNNRFDVSEIKIVTSEAKEEGVVISISEINDEHYLELDETVTSNIRPAVSPEEILRESLVNFNKRVTYKEFFKLVATVTEKEKKKSYSITSTGPVDRSAKLAIYSVGESVNKAKPKGSKRYYKDGYLYYQGKVNGKGKVVWLKEVRSPDSFKVGMNSSLLNDTLEHTSTKGNTMNFKLTLPSKSVGGAIEYEPAGILVNDLIVAGDVEMHISVNKKTKNVSMIMMDFTNTYKFVDTTKQFTNHQVSVQYNSYGTEVSVDVPEYVLNNAVFPNG